MKHVATPPFIRKLRRSAAALRGAYALLAFTAACDLTVDPDLTQPDDAGAKADAASLDADLPVVEAGSANDGSIPSIDATSEITDGGLVWPDADMTDGGVACSSDGECQASAFCSAIGSCLPRCDGERGCIGPQAPGMVTSLAVSGNTIYGATQIVTDTLGNPLNHGLLFAWPRDGGLSPLIGHDAGKIVWFVLDGYVYFDRHEFPSLGALYRTATHALGAPPAQLASNVTNSWYTPTHVMWAQQTGTEQELWRVSRTPGGSAELAATAPEGEWVTGNSTLGVIRSRRNDTPTLVVVRLSDMVEQGSIVLNDDSLGAAPQATCDEARLYYTESNGIRRVLFSDLSHPLTLATGLMPGSMRFSLSGGWMYWSGQGAVYLTGRSQRDAMVAPQALGYPGVFLRNELVHVDNIEKRLFVKPLSPLPCSTAMPCPADLSCSAALLCE